jgi:hypothetical protein
LAVVVAAGHGGEGDEAEALVEGDEVGVADEVDHVEVAEAGDEAADELGADALPAVGLADFEVGDVGAGDAVADGGDVAEDGAGVAVAGEEDVVAAAQDAQEGFGAGGSGQPAKKPASWAGVR